jgi:hypothetical protein
MLPPGTGFSKAEFARYEVRRAKSALGSRGRDGGFGTVHVLH